MVGPKEKMSIFISTALPLRNIGRKSKYPFSELEVGQSCFIDNTKVTTVSSAACTFGKVHGRKFKTKTSEGGVLVKRVR